MAWMRCISCDWSGTGAECAKHPPAGPQPELSCPACGDIVTPTEEEATPMPPPQPTTASDLLGIHAAAYVHRARVGKAPEGLGITPRQEALRDTIFAGADTEEAQAAVNVLHAQLVKVIGNGGHNALTQMTICAMLGRSLIRGAAIDLARISTAFPEPDCHAALWSIAKDLPAAMVETMRTPHVGGQG